MQIKVDKTYNVGVLVARFQVHALTEAHKELVNMALSNHAKVIIFLGLSPVRASISDPLDFQPRKQMILEEYPPSKYPNLTVGYIKDAKSNQAWSDKLDELISDHLGPNDKAVLYGGRDSFLAHYKGNFPTRELSSTITISGTQIRNEIAQAPKDDPSFRRGAIWASYQRFPTVYPTVDVAILDVKNNRFLLGRKADEKEYRFIGGFTSPSDNSYEDAAIRETFEECGLGLDKNSLFYIGSLKVDDWRYKGSSTEQIITHLYVGNYGYGSPKAADDLADVRWFDLTTFNAETMMVDTHRPLFNMFRDAILARGWVKPSDFHKDNETKIVNVK
jgi:bifunctional NMN adenylyltransferase/nudix hydrolase